MQSIKIQSYALDNYDVAVRIICNWQVRHYKKQKVQHATNTGIGKGDFVKVRQEQSRLVIEKA